jgi:hypothetical protein
LPVPVPVPPATAGLGLGAGSSGGKDGLALLSTVRAGLRDTLVSGAGAGSKRRDLRGYL